MYGQVYKTGMLYYIKQRAIENEINGNVFYFNRHSIGVNAVGTKNKLDNFIQAICSENPFASIDNYSVIKTEYQSYESFSVLDNLFATNHPSNQQQNGEIHKPRAPV